MDVASNPFSANSDRPTSSNCSRRSLPVMRTRGRPSAGLILRDPEARGALHETTSASVDLALAQVLSRFSRSGRGHRTSVAQPSFSNIQIKQADAASCPRSTPVRAPVGSAWCVLCQPSPKLITARGQKLELLSRAVKGRSPMVTYRVDRPGDVMHD